MNQFALGRRIHTARRERGLTGEKLSELCSINAVYLRQIESGLKTPSLPVFVSVCQALKVSPEYLLAEDLPDIGDAPNDALLQRLNAAPPKEAEMLRAMLTGALDVLEKQEHA